MKNSVLIVLFLVFNQSVFAQSGQLKGIVTNSEGQAAPYVAIQLKEIKRGSTSDDKGEFVISNIKANTYTLVASFVGYKTLEQKIKIEEGKTLNLSLELFENTETLKEIVVKGYVSQNERMASIGKIAIRPMDLPISIQTIDRQILENQQVMTMQDVLMNTNGVYVMGATGGYQEEISARGFAMSSTNTFKNGTRFINSMMPELSGIERVEIMKGSAAILFGNVAAGGILNLVTKKPKFGFGGEVGLRTGSFGLIKPTIDIYGGIGKNEKIALRLNTTWQKANSFRQYVQSERFYINPSLLFKITKKTDFLLEADYLEDDRTPDFGAGIINYEVVDLPRERFLGVKWGYIKSRQLSSTGTLTHRFNDKWKVSLTSSYRNFEQRLFANTRPNAGNLIKTDGLWTRNLQKSENYDDYFIFQGDLNGTFHTKSIKHELLMGFDTDRFTQTTQQYNNLNMYDTINIFQDLPAESRNDIPEMSKGNLSENPTYRYGIYLQDLVSLAKKLKVLAGIRYSNQKSESIVTTFEGKTTTTDTPAEGVFSPRLGLVYQPNPNHSFFVSYSNSFVLNTGVDINGNTLPPSLIDQYEAGIKNQFLDGKASINLTVYQIDNRNMAQMSLANANTYTYIKELVGHVRSKGVELDFTAKPFQNLMVMLGYSYNQTKYVKSNTFIEGSLLRYNPNHTANASVNYRFEAGKLRGFSLGMTGVYIGTRYAGRSTRVQVANDAYKIFEIPSYTQIDATASYTYKNISVRGKVGNVLDVLSYNVHDDNSVNPITPRNYSLSLSYKF
jgi:iron complex outermembrane receptor protein